MNREIYFDNSATTKIRDDVLDYIIKFYIDIYGNPSSLHRKGIKAEESIHKSRNIISKTINSSPDEIIFTSGGTEANNLAINGIAHRYQRRGRHLITSKIEHPSVTNVFKQLEKKGFDVSYINVNENGVICLNELKKAITPNTILASIMMVNNEIGSIQPIKQISQIIRNYNKDIIFHVDGVQALGKIPIDVEEAGIDLFTISGHKLHGPKGSGALYVRDRLELIPIFEGGGQERGLRSGTENVPAITGMGKAIKIASAEINNFYEHVMNMRKFLISEIQNKIPDTYLNGPDMDSDLCAPHIANISFLGIKGEILVHALEEYGIYISTGAACSSKKTSKSHVLDVMGCSPERIESSVRFSFSILNTMDEVRFCVDKLIEVVKELRSIIRR